MTGPADGALVARVRAGDADAYAVLVGRYQEVLFRYAFGVVRCGDLAADLVQDAFVKAYTRLESCQEPDRFGAWVYRILVNRCKDHLKSRRRHTVPLEEDTAAAPETQGASVEADRGELRSALARALAALPPLQREAFHLKHVEERPYEEISEILGVSVSALKMRVFRAREALQEALRDLADPV